MADIVERLLDYSKDDHERGCQGRYYVCTCGYDNKRDPLLVEAAKTIESLRAELAEARNAAPSDGAPDWEDVRGIAPDATGDLSSEDWVRRQRDEWDTETGQSPAPSTGWEWMREQAAKVAAKYGKQAPTWNRDHDAGWDNACLVIETAIRALPPPPEGEK